MQLFRNLAGNFFFKIILGFVALSFVLFGISGFLLGNPNSWVLKVGKNTIGQSSFNQALKNDREIIMASNKSPEAMKYLESEQFKSAVLGRMVNRIMIEKLRDEFGVSASRDIILKAVAQDPTFKNKEGKFDQEIFTKFLAKNGFNEEKYINEISNDVVAAMIIQTIPMVAPINIAQAVEIENFKQEKRLADIITISSKNIGAVAKPTEEELAKFFEENKQNYSAPEARKVSYLEFSKNNFAKDFAISDAEVLAEYEKNKQNYLTPERRVFYHILFDEEKAAKEFSDKLNEATKLDKSMLKAEFTKLAKETQKKDLKALKLAVFEKDLIAELASPTFKLGLNERSEILKSPLGFHIFVVDEIKKSQPISFAELKDGIKKQMLQGREEKVLQAKTSEIDDALLTSNSLEEVAKKFNLKISGPITIGENDQVSNLENFAKNAFLAPKGQVSKIFYAPKTSGFYALKVEEIEAAHSRKFEEVKSQVTADLNTKKQLQALQLLAKKVSDEIKSNPNSVTEIVKKYKLKLEKNREFPRVIYMNFQGRQVPYQNKFLEELFAAKLNQSTAAQNASEQEFVIGVVRQIKKAAVASAQFEANKKQAEDSFKTEILQEFNSYLLKKNPVQVNEKLFGQKEEAAK
jgi:peptidyl-prolyl cis-trans isomerase D